MGKPVGDGERPAGGAVRANNQTWYGRRFTFTFPRGAAVDKSDLLQANGLEVSCMWHHRCRKGLKFAKHGGRELVEQWLKYWCIVDEDHEGQKVHRDCLTEMALTDLPDNVSLEALGYAQCLARIEASEEGFGC